MKLNRKQLRKMILKEAAVSLDPQGIQSMRAQRSFLHDNFEDDPQVYKDRITSASKVPRYAALDVAMPLLNCEHLTLAHISEFIIAAELDHGMTGLIDYVLDVDV